MNRRPLSTSRYRCYPLLAIVVACCGHAPRSDTPATPSLDEPALMAKVRETVTGKPETALALADEGEQRFGESAAAEERRALAITALINLQRIGAARSRAYDFLRRYPDGPHAANVAAMTGVHPTPSGPKSDPH